MNYTLKLLILGNNPEYALVLKRLLEKIETDRLIKTSFESVHMESLEQGTHYIETNPVDLILLDLSLAGKPGLLPLKEIQKIDFVREIPVIILTDLDDKEAGIEALKMGAQQFLVKGEFTPKLLAISIRYAIERQRLKLKLEKETQELKNSENRLVEIISHSPDSIIIVDSQKQILFMNPAAEILLGDEARILPENTFRFSIVTDEKQTKEIEFIHQEGYPVIAEMRGVKIAWQGEEAWLISLRDISEKKKLLNAIQKEKEQLDFTLRSIADGVIATDEKGTILLINEMAARMTGWSKHKAVGKPLREIVKLKNLAGGQILDNFEDKVIKNGESVEITGISDWVSISRHKEEIPCQFSCAPIVKESEVMGAVLIINDISIEKELEEESIRVKNLEALGVMAAGIAHQYNNILTAVLGYLSLSKKILGENHQGFNRLKKAEKAASRAREISQRLFTFTKGGEPFKIKDSILPALQHAVQETIEKKYLSIDLEWDINPDIWPVFYDPQQIQLAVGNILKNAAEAMYRYKRIDIKVENIRVRGVKSALVKRGNYVKISIGDQGKGIPAEHLTKIFNPYFSTKPNKEGMGLTTAYSIIQKHGGWLRVKSGPDGGTSVSILLPAAVTLPREEKPTETGPQEENIKRESDSRKKRVLVMDDEDIIREIAQEMLEFLECEAILVENGEEALEVYRRAMESGNAIDAVLLDLVIPAGMGGKECISKLMDLDPKVKAIVSSGYSDDPVITNFQDYGFSGVLPKPYKIHELEKALERLQEL